jgi:type II secretion system protein N
MIRRVAIGLGAVAAFFVFFLVGFFATFPSGAAAERAMWEVQQRSAERYRLELAALRPALVGATATDLTLWSRTGRARGEEAASYSQLFRAAKFKARTGLLDLLRLGGVLGGDATVSGFARIGDADLDYTIGLSRGETGFAPHLLQVEGPGLPLLVAGLQMAGVQGTASGDIDLDADLDLADGLGKADGKVALLGKDIVLTGVRIEGTGTLADGMDLPEVRISELDVLLDVVDGRARVSRGRIVSNVVTLDLEGDIALADDPGKSRLRMKLVAGDVGDDFSVLAMALKAAEWADGRYHYQWNTPLSPLRAPRPDRERTRRPPSPGAPKGPPRAAGADDEESAVVPDVDRAAIDEERRLRREERLAARKERLANEPGPVRPGAVPFDPEGGDPVQPIDPEFMDPVENVPDPNGPEIEPLQLEDAPPGANFNE